MEVEKMELRRHQGMAEERTKWKKELKAKTKKNDLPIAQGSKLKFRIQPE
jgi:hypothetical protein